MTIVEVYGRDLVIGNFVASEYQCYLASFDSDGSREEETGIGVETTEEFIADNPIPVYIGQKYSDKLHPKAVLTKDSCVTTEEYFSEYDCRAIIRLITGKRGYQWMKIITDEVGEDLWYRVRINKISYNKVNGLVAGIILDMECDSQFAWSIEKNITVNATANVPFTIYTNGDELYDYIHPYVTFKSSGNGTLEVTNQNDNNWKVSLSNVSNGETVIYDSQHRVIDGSRNSSGTAITKYLDNSNCRFFRLVNGTNTYVSSLSGTFTFKFREPRKVAFAII